MKYLLLILVSFSFSCKGYSTSVGVYYESNDKRFGAEATFRHSGKQPVEVAK